MSKIEELEKEISEIREKIKDTKNQFLRNLYNRRESKKQDELNNIKGDKS